MSKIIRTKTEAKGGITEAESHALAEHAKKWINIALRTEPIDHAKITEAIEGLYRVSGFKPPRVVIVPSPLVMAFAGSIAAAWWDRRNNATVKVADKATYNATVKAAYNAIVKATDNATDIATMEAAYNATAKATTEATAKATDIATVKATDKATDNRTRDAIYNAIVKATYNAAYNATDKATDNATVEATDIAKLFLGSDLAAFYKKLSSWSDAYFGGNMWASYDCYLSAWRDVLGLDLPIFEKYKYWEMAAQEGGFRYSHPEFCMVSDFPLYIRQNKANQPHCDGAPSHEWRDGWKLWHLNGVAVKQWMAETPPEKLDAKQILKIENVDQRREVLRRLGVNNLVKQLGGKVIDSDYSTGSAYELLDLDIGLEQPCRYLKMRNPSIDAIHVEGVPNECMTVADAINWRRYGNIKLEWKPSQLS